jgi:Na+/glutamate symporter
MKLAFIPVSVIGGILAGLIGQKVFEAIWSKVDEQEPPEPDQREVSLAKLAIALLIEGAIFRLVKGLFDHAARRGFARMTGAWPGEEAPDKA